MNKSTGEFASRWSNGSGVSESGSRAIGRIDGSTSDDPNGITAVDDLCSSSCCDIFLGDDCQCCGFSQSAADLNCATDVDVSRVASNGAITQSKKWSISKHVCNACFHIDLAVHLFDSNFNLTLTAVQIDLISMPITANEIRITRAAISMFAHIDQPSIEC